VGAEHTAINNHAMTGSHPQPTHPSGAQVEICHADQRAWVVEVGGALRAYRVAGHDVLDGYTIDERCTGARGQSLIPWPNRLRDGLYHFADRDHQLPLTEPGKLNAIHGLTRWANWSPDDRAADRVTMRHRLHPQPGYPFALELAITYTLTKLGLSVATTAINIGTTPCPFGTGAHPYLTVGTPNVDSVVLRAPGQVWLPTDGRGIPIGSETVNGTDYEFLEPRPIGAVKLDTAYGDLVRDEDGLARVKLLAPDERTSTLWLDANYRYLMLFTGDSLTDPDRRRRGLGIEPMTCAPNAFQTGEGLRTLQPGESCTTTWGITASIPWAE
jgi:aldose 1-epimerase